jgi:DNA-binding transcriptional regulator WhiA
MISESIKLKIKHYYLNEKIGGKKISLLLNINEKTVYRYLKNNNLTKTLAEATLKNYCNDTYFSEIDNSQKAYWLGVLFADGNVSRKNSKTGKIFFSSIDKEWIELFKKEINFTGKITKETHKKYKKDIYKISITSKIMFEDLVKLGCTPNKTFTLKFPKLKKELTSHFIRGYFDGDGSV